MAKNFLEIDNVTFAASEKSKVNNVSLTIENEGDIICLLGPSGIGKTTILRTIAGLEKIQSGTISLKNKIISSKNVHIEPENRNISLAFQDNSLFPHYNVIQNIQFGAERNKKNKKTLTIDEVVEFLHLDHIKDKFPHQISSGEAQRAALARALLSKPDLLLLDEPLSNVDQSFKEEIQVKLKQILTDLKITTIIVTHDSYEAFYLGSKCGIILDSQLKQYDDPYNVYHFPNSIEVVNFLNRGILIPAKVTGENSLENEDLGTIKGNFIKHYPKGSDVQLLLQPEDLEHDDKSNLKLEVVDRKFRGTNFIYTLKTNNGEFLPVFVHSHHIHQHEVDESVIPVDVTCHQGGDEVGGEGDGESVGDGAVAAQAGKRRVRWKVPKKRRGVIPDGMVQSRLLNFVEQFPNLEILKSSKFASIGEVAFGPSFATFLKLILL